jgi:hypothetical protein
MLMAVRRASSAVSTLACIASASVARAYTYASGGVADSVAAGHFVDAPLWGKSAIAFDHRMSVNRASFAVYPIVPIGALLV